MNKKQFLEKLQGDLGVGSDDDVINYYEELIDDAIENGASEKEAVEKLGRVEDIARAVRIENRMKAQKKKNLFSNAFILMTILLILSSPLLLPLIVVGFVLLFTAFLLLFVLILTFGILALSFALAPVAALVNLINGDMTIQGFVMVIGASLFVVGASIILTKLLVQLLSKLSGFIYSKAKKSVHKLKKQGEE